MNLPNEMWLCISTHLSIGDWKRWRVVQRLFWNLTLHDPYPGSEVFLSTGRYFMTLRKALIHHREGCHRLREKFPHLSLWKMDLTSTFYEDLVESFRELGILSCYPETANYSLWKMKVVGEGALQEGKAFASFSLRAISSSLTEMARYAIIRDLDCMERVNPYQHNYWLSQIQTKRQDLVTSYTRTHRVEVGLDLLEDKKVIDLWERYLSLIRLHDPGNDPGIEEVMVE